MTRTIAIAALFAAAALPAAADHANPWASADDAVMSQFHEENQARSADTPGEDEMNGVMERNARGKLGDDAVDVAAGDGDGGQGGSGGEGGHGEGGGGEGGQGGGGQGGGGQGGGNGGGGNGGGHGRG